MGRGETSDVSGIPTLNRLLADVDEAKGNHTKLSVEFDEFKKNTNEKLDEEAQKVIWSILTSRVLQSLIVTF